MKKAFFLFLLIVIIAPLRSQAPAQEDKEINIKMRVSQWNVVLKALRELPFKEADEPINTIVSQASLQLQAEKPVVDSTRKDSTQVKKPVVKTKKK